jgi:hypothetical protein
MTYAFEAYKEEPEEGLSSLLTGPFPLFRMKFQVERLSLVSNSSLYRSCLFWLSFDGNLFGLPVCSNGG